MCYFSIIHYNSLYNPIRGIKSEYGFIICLATLRKTLVQFVCFSIVRYFNISKSIVSAVSRSFPTYKKYIYIFIQPQGQFKLYIYAIYIIYIYLCHIVEPYLVVLLLTITIGEAAEKELEELRKKLAESQRQSAAGEPMATLWQSGVWVFFPWGNPWEIQYKSDINCLRNPSYLRIVLC